VRSIAAPTRCTRDVFSGSRSIGKRRAGMAAGRHDVTLRGEAGRHDVVERAEAGGRTDVPGRAGGLLGR
jgi:hypothetical protein